MVKKRTSSMSTFFKRRLSISRGGSATKRSHSECVRGEEVSCERGEEVSCVRGDGGEGGGIWLVRIFSGCGKGVGV